MSTKLDFSKVWWLTPIHGAVPHPSFHDIKALAHYKMGMQIRTMMGEPEMNGARTKLANLALNSGADITLWVDCDNVPSPETIIWLVRKAQQTRQPHSAVYMRQTSDLATDDRATKSLSFQPEQAEVWNFSHRTMPRQVKLAGFGCWAIPRESYEAIEKYCPRVEWGSGEPLLDGPHWCMPEMDGTTYLKSDKVLCHRLRKAGIPITVWPGHHVIHFKTLGLMPPEGSALVNETGVIEQ